MYQVGAACYSTPTAATQAIASNQTGAIVQHGGAGYIATAAGSEQADRITGPRASAEMRCIGTTF